MPVEFSEGTVLGIWYGLRRLSQTERVLNRRLARVNRRERKESTLVQCL